MAMEMAMEMEIVMPTTATIRDQQILPTTTSTLILLHFLLLLLQPQQQAHHPTMMKYKLVAFCIHCLLIIILLIFINQSINPNLQFSAPFFHSSISKSFSLIRVSNLCLIFLLRIKQC